MTTENPTRRGTRLFCLIMAVILILPVLLAGGLSLYRQANPEPPVERLARAIDAYKGNEIAIAHRLFKSLAAQGNATAEYWLADMHEHGLATAKSLPEAVKLLEQSSAHGFAAADLRLGELYLAGVAVAPDLAKAVQYLQRAAATGSPKALRLDGQMLSLGVGVAPDAPKAYAYFIAAADRGDMIAKSERDRLSTTLTPEQIATATVLAKTLASPTTK